jgi:hypothetical protein
MDDHPEPGRELLRLCLPVADDRRWGDDERRSFARGASDVSEHGRRLAEPHVERETAAEAHAIEEAEPSERLGLIRTQAPDEPDGRGVNGGRNRCGLLE